jgi:hypothetical protein
MTLVPQLSQKPKARAKTSRWTLADGLASRDDPVGTRRNQSGAFASPVLRNGETRLRLFVTTGHPSAGSIRKLCSCR